MPSAVVLTDRKLCRNCDKADKLQKCGKCKLARYCSVECQRQHWPIHKKHCKDHAAEIAGNYAEPLFKPFTTWFSDWSKSIQAWGIYAADFANHPRDFLNENCFVVVIKKSSDNAKANRSFSPVSAEFLDDDKITTYIRSMSRYTGQEYVQERLRDYGNLPRSAGIIRTLIICELLTGFSYQPIEVLATQGDLFRLYRHEFSKQVAGNFFSSMQHDISHGKVDGYTKF